MKKCKSHHYVYTRSGRFVCTECGHVRFATRRIKKLIAISAFCIVVLIGSVMVYENFDIISSKTTTVSNFVMAKTIYNKPLVTKITGTAMNISNAIEDRTNIQVGPPPSLQELRQIALEDINNYRNQNGVGSLTLGNAKSPQLYSEELLKEGCIHHVDSKGQGPMLRYKTNGDTMFLVGENIASRSDAVLTSPKSMILNEDHDMMFDDASSNWGHKKNILDPSYSSVSIGIANSGGTLIMVQDFQAVLPAGYEYDPSSFQTEPMDEKLCL